MPATRTLTVELPEELAAFVERTVHSGAYESGGALVIHALRDREYVANLDIEWLKAEVLPALAEYDADPSTGVDLHEAFRRLRHRRRSQAA